MICNHEDLIFYWFENINLHLLCFHNLIFNNIYKRGPLKDSNEYYVHEITVRFYQAYGFHIKNFNGHYVVITEGIYL
jgi:hypothetical protein